MRVEIDGVRYVPEPKDSDSQELNALRRERESVIRLLREACEEYGDNDWPDTLHLRDVLEKHLLDYLGASDWYSIDNKLPEDDKEVLAFVLPSYECTVGFYKGVWHLQRFNKETVVAWRELPERPFWLNEEQKDD